MLGRDELGQAGARARYQRSAAIALAGLLGRHPRDDLSSIFAFPLAVGPLRIGAIDLYSRRARSSWIDAQTKQADAMAAVVGRHVLRQALNAVGSDGDDIGNAYSRRLIHQATGIVLAQLDLSADDARLVIHGHAFAASVR